MASAKVTEFLTKHLTIQKEIVTYRLLSRELGIHVNEAKNELAAFYASARASEQPVHATFLLTGKAAPFKRDENEMDVDSSPVESVSVAKMMLVGEDELEDAKRQFVDEPSFHVYSLSAAVLKDIALLTTTFDQVRLQDVTKGKAFNEAVGITVGSDVKLGNGQPARAKAAHPQPVASSSKAATFTKKEETNLTTGTKKPADKSKPLEKKKPGTLDWSRAKPKASKVTDDAKNNTEASESERTTTKKNDSKDKEVKKERPVKEILSKKTDSKKKASNEDKELTVREILAQKVDDSAKRGKKRPSNVMLSESEDDVPSQEKPSTVKEILSKKVDTTKKENQESKEHKELSVKEILSKKVDDSAKRGKKRPSNVMLSESEDDAPSPTTKQRKSKSPERERTNNGKRNMIVSDDEDSRSTTRNSQPSKKGKGRLIVSDDEDGAPPSMRAMMDLDDDLVTRRGVKPETEPEDEDVEMQDEEDAVPVPKRKVNRKPKKVIPVGKNGLPKRKVVKTRKTKNAKGYTVTEDYSSYESVSESEQSPNKEEKSKGAKKIKEEAETDAHEEKTKVQTKKKPSGKPKGGDLTNYFKKK